MNSVKNVTVSGMRTICEVHREMYDIVIEDDVVNEHLIELLEEAFQMAKKMNQKLRQYKNNYDDNWWKQTRKEIIKEKLDKRERRQKNV